MLVVDRDLPAAFFVSQQAALRRIEWPFCQALCHEVLIGIYEQTVPAMHVER